MIRIKLIILFVTISTFCFSQNPLLVHSNEPLAFDKVTSPVIREAVKEISQRSDRRVDNIIKAGSSDATISSVLPLFDELQYDLSDLLLKLGLIGATYESDSIRNSADKGYEELSIYSSNLLLNENLYKTMKRFADSKQAAAIAPNHKKFLRELIVAFENNGMKLDETGRKKLEAINEKLIAFGIQFDKNLAESRDSVVFNQKDIEGVPDQVSAKWKRPEGNFVIYVNNPNYQDIARYAVNDRTRFQMYFKYNNRAYPENLQVLDSLLYYRQVYATTLGFRSFAQNALVTKMAAKPENVWKFEYDLIDKLTPFAKDQLGDLRQVKKQMHPELSDTIFAWDVLFYRKQLLDTKYQLNTDSLRSYFEMNNTIKGMFDVYQRLFGIEIKETQNVPVWYHKVRTFDMYKEGKKIGSFYFDLYPRANKYTHFACFQISQYRKAEGKEVLPVAALICNFPEGSAAEPSLLNHTDVITLFHEFGHLVHFTVVRSDLASQPGTVKPDFVEAPSQFLENWCWEYPSLKLFAKHYKTGAVLPESMFEKMRKAKEVQEGSLNYIRQVYLGSVDFTFHDKYDSIKKEDINQVANNLQHIMLIPQTEGTHFICGFTHLNGYAANYYGYLWSKVYAQDMFSVFEKNGVMDSKTGIRYRKEILEVLGSVDEKELVRKFLGREPNNDAFMRSIGVKEQKGF
ncbi:MAG: hypothetical protein C5B59_00890 [Bacteroidetes bacterium]|nr:MAG: hypothetical protein C5B59_00890 [Bacteroidota bacterium]